MVLNNLPVIVSATDRETVPPGMGIINRVTPSQIAPVAKVTINGGNPFFDIKNPLITPTPNPTKGGINNHKIMFNGVLIKGRLAAITLVNPIIAPIDKSIPPVRTTKV